MDGGQSGMVAATMLNRTGSNTMWLEYVNRISGILANLVVTEREERVLPTEDGFSQWVSLASNKQPGFSIHLVGNGASSSFASHFAADITKNCGISAGVFTDPALLTALANDHGYDNAFAIALTRYANSGDLLVAISSSGESPNIINVCNEAEQMGVDIVTISGKKPTNALRKMGLLNFYVDGPTFSLAESAHTAILHHWIDCLEAAGAAQENA